MRLDEDCGDGPAQAEQRGAHLVQEVQETLRSAVLGPAADPTEERADTVPPSPAPHEALHNVHLHALQPQAMAHGTQ
eukprot:scaffold2260_cov134-Isochrysis_galbana.AAC.7